PGTRPPEFAPQIEPPLRRPGDLQAPDAVPARLTVELQRAVELDRPPGQRRHRLRGVRLENQTWRMRRGAAGVEQRPLIEYDDVAQPLSCQIVGRTGADDAGSDDDERGAGLH